MQESAHCADAEGDVFRLHVGEGLVAAQIFGGGEEGGDWAFAGAAEEVGSGEVNVESFDGTEGKADGAVEGDVGIEEIVAHRRSRRMDSPAQGGPGVGGCIIQWREDGAGGDGEGLRRAHWKRLLTVGRESTMKVQMPSAVPKGMFRQAMAAIT